MGKFSSSLANFATKTRKTQDRICAEVVYAVGASVVLKSPVGNPDLWKTPPPKGYVGGRFRASWQHGLGSIPAATEFAPDASGSSALGRIGVAVSNGAAGQRHFIVNRLPYARPLEYGHSTQAPHGMVGITVAEFRRHVSAAIGKVR